MKTFKIDFKNIAGLCVMLLCFAFANAQYIKIDMLNKLGNNYMVYSSDIAYVEVGDSITWIPKDLGHNVHFIKAPVGVKELPRSEYNKEFTYTFTKKGIYLYQCTPHVALGMIGLVVVGGDKSNQDQIAKTELLGMSKPKLTRLLKELR